MQAKQKTSLKQINAQILNMHRRLKKLKQNNNGQVESTKKHKSLTKQIIMKKLMMAQSFVEQSKAKQELAQREAQKIRELKLRNQHRRAKHNLQLNNIMKAVYLVKVDDYQEMKKISEDHRNKIKDLQSADKQEKKVRRSRIRSQGGKQEKFWKDKLYKQYLENHAVKLFNEQQTNKKKQQLSRLQSEEAELLNSLSHNQLISSKSKREYVSALSMPIREIASALNLNQTKKESGLLFSDRKTRDKSQYNIESIIQNAEQEEVHFPKTEVNQAKLKIILEKLRKKNNS